LKLGNKQSKIYLGGNAVALTEFLQKLTHKEDIQVSFMVGQNFNDLQATIDFHDEQSKAGS